MNAHVKPPLAPLYIAPDGKLLSIWRGLVPQPINKIQIKRYVADKYELTVEDLEGESRARRIAHPRQEAMWMMRQIVREDGTWRYSLPDIGRSLGCRDHTTVLHGVREHQARLDALQTEEAA